MPMYVNVNEHFAKATLFDKARGYTAVLILEFLTQMWKSEIILFELHFNEVLGLYNVILSSGGYKNG